MKRTTTVLLAAVVAAVMMVSGAPTASAERVLPKSLECGGSTKAVAIQVWLMGMAPVANHYIYKKPAPGTWHQAHSRPAPNQWWLSTTRSTYGASLDNNVLTGGDYIDHTRSKTFCWTLPS